VFDESVPHFSGIYHLVCQSRNGGTEIEELLGSPRVDSSSECIVPRRFPLSLTCHFCQLKLEVPRFNFSAERYFLSVWKPAKD
jgi:hypothetical protein